MMTAIMDRIPKVQTGPRHWEKTSTDLNCAPLVSSKNTRRGKGHLRLMALENGRLGKPGEILIASTRKHHHHH